MTTLNSDDFLISVRVKFETYHRITYLRIN